MIEVILFDMDGVIIDSEPLYLKAERLMLGKYGIVMSEEEKKSIKGITEKAFFTYIEERFNPGWDREKLMKEGREFLLFLFSRELKFVQGFLPLMDRFHGLFLMGLVTSTTRQLIEEIFRILPFKQMFKEIVCADDISNSKPHPEPYLTMMNRLHVEPDIVMVIEDSLHGVMSAKAAGARCIALEGSFTRDELHMADWVVKSLDEIDINLIQKIVK